MEKKKRIKELTETLQTMVGVKMSPGNCKSFVTLCFAASESIENQNGLTQIINEYNKPIFENPIPTNKVQAIANFIDAEHCLDRKNLIPIIFEDEKEDEIKRISDLFLFQARKSLVDLMPMLDQKLQGKLIVYIINNYNVVTSETIERYYF